MPSFKVTFASLALLGLASFSNAVETPVDASHVSRRVVDIERREVAGVAAARVLAAKRRAVKAAKRSAEDTSSLVERQSFDPSLDPIAAFIAYQKTPCTSSTTCVAAGRTEMITSPYGITVCNFRTRFCAVTCSSGYVGPNSTGRCVPSSASCPPAPVHGVYVGKACTLKCDSALGYTIQSVNGVATCVNLTSDPNNCGGVGALCPYGYARSDIPTCFRAQCGLICPSGQSPFPTASGRTYCR